MAADERNAPSELTSRALLSGVLSLDPRVTLSALADDCCLTWATLEDDGTEVEEDGGRGAVVSAADEVDLSLRSWS